MNASHFPCRLKPWRLLIPYRRLYKKRASIECQLGKVKQFRRVFSRFAKLACRYLTFAHLGAACILFG